MLDLGRIKDKILDELMEDMDDHESEKLKPKAAISITAIKPKEDGEMPPGMDDPVAALGHGEPDGDEDEDDELLRKLLMARESGEL